MFFAVLGSKDADSCAQEGTCHGMWKVVCAPDTSRVWLLESDKAVSKREVAAKCARRVDLLNELGSPSQECGNVDAERDDRTETGDGGTRRRPPRVATTTRQAEAKSLAEKRPNAGKLREPEHSRCQVGATPDVAAVPQDRCRRREVVRGALRKHAHG